MTGKLAGGVGKLGSSAKNNVDGIISVAKPSKLSHEIRRHINSKAAHEPERAKTLMRSGLEKPKKSQIKLSKAQLSKSDSLIASTATLLDTRASRKALADARRENLAKQITQHPKVRHFTDSVVTYAGPKAANVVHNLPKHPHLNKPNTAKTTRERTEELLAAGLAKAKSHEEPAPKVKKMRRSTKFYIKSGITLLVLAIIVLGVYIFRAQIEVQLASWRSGVSAELPSYVPNGYGFKGPVHFATGSVTIGFQDGQDSITIDESNSSWDSQTLKDQEVTVNSTNFQTEQSKGRTIYLYGQGNATWVNDGVWYLVSSSPSVSNAQLLKIVNSM